MDDDKSLVRRAVRGDRKAFEMIIRKYQQPLMNYLGRILADRELCADFAQDIFLKALRSLKSYKPAYKFSTWIYKIASNHVIDYWRKKQLTPISTDTFFFQEECQPRSLQIVDPGESIARKYELSELRQAVEKALFEIPITLRELFVLRHVSELSYEEIAEIKSLPVGTVKNRVFQAKEILREKLEAGS